MPAARCASARNWARRRSPVSASCPPRASSPAPSALPARLIAMPALPVTLPAAARARPARAGRTGARVVAFQGEAVKLSFRVNRKVWGEALRARRRVWGCRQCRSFTHRRSGLGRRLQPRAIPLHTHPAGAGCRWRLARRWRWWASHHCWGSGTPSRRCSSSGATAMSGPPRPPCPPGEGRGLGGGAEPGAAPLLAAAAARRRRRPQ